MNLISQNKKENTYKPIFDFLYTNKHRFNYAKSKWQY